MLSKLKLILWLGLVLITIAALACSGSTGPQGPAGSQGPAGERGVQGPEGPQGPQGEQGPPGSQGPGGSRGLIGPQGPAGEQGTVGPQGPRGFAGQRGEQGPPGASGESVVVSESPDSPPTETPVVALNAASSVIDARTHLMSVDFASIVGAASGSSAEDLIARLDEANIERAFVLSLGFDGRLPSDREARDENEFIVAEVAKFPDRLIGFCGINPTFSISGFETGRCLREDGMVGVALDLRSSGADLTNSAHLDAVSEIFDAIEAAAAPVYIQVTDSPLGLPLDNSSIETLVSNFAAHPNARVILGSCGGPEADESIEMWRQALASNGSGIDLSISPVFIEISECLNTYEDAPPSKRELIVWSLRQWGLDRVLFGSGYLMGTSAQTPMQTLDTLTKYPFTQEEIDQILANTEARLTGAQ